MTFKVTSPVQCLDSTVGVWRDAVIKEMKGEKMLIHFTEKFTSNKFDMLVSEGLKQIFK